VWYLIMAGGRFEWTAYLLIAGPLFLAGALFLVDWVYHAVLRSSA
jgi:hypothetical protein